MEYWIVYKIQNGKCFYISDIDDDGNLKYTEDKSKAFKICNFDLAMRCFSKDHIVKKEFSK